MNFSLNKESHPDDTVGMTFIYLNSKYFNDANALYLQLL